MVACGPRLVIVGSTSSVRPILETMMPMLSKLIDSSIRFRVSSGMFELERLLDRPRLLVGLQGLGRVAGHELDVGDGVVIPSPVAPDRVDGGRVPCQDLAESPRSLQSDQLLLPGRRSI